MLTSEINRIAERTAELVKMQIDTLMTSKQCAEYLGISEAALRKRCNRGNIPCHKKHGSWMLLIRQ